MTARSRGRARSLVFVCLVAVAAALAFGAASAHAYKPYTHNFTGDRAWEDVTDDGHVTIEGREYAARPEVVAALKANRPYFNAGVVGPDGFPDLTYGQQVIHPEQTGKWLRHILKKAWQAQDDASYSAAEKQQILAFAYGYLTHAAGDMWAHTLVNDVAHGVFPSVSEIVSDEESAEVAIRHIIVEGYIGDATPGYDGNPDRKLIPGEVNEDGNPQVSDTSTPHVPFAAPKRFIYETLIDPNAPLPVGTCGDGIDDDNDGSADDGCPGGAPVKGDPEPVRGPLIDFFLDMRAKLEVARERFRFDAETLNCAPLPPACMPEVEHMTVQTVRGPKNTSVTYWKCYVGACAPELVFDGPHNSLVSGLVMLYIDNWIEDIDTGLKNWSDLGLASSRALFDPRATRQAQDQICRNKPDDEFSFARAECENGVGPVDVLGEEAEDFITNHMVSMLGAPDAVGDYIEIMSDVSDVLSDIFGPELNPLEEGIAAAKSYAKEKIKAAIEEETHISIDHLKSFLTAPTHWLEVQAVTFDLPGVGTKQLDLFTPGTHQKLDALMQLPADHHQSQTVTVPGSGQVQSTGLKDDVVFDQENFAAYRNAVQTAKLLLLDADGLNAALTDILADDIKVGVSTYKDGATVPANVMVDQLSGSLPWLRSIDSDHPWRADGLPRYCSTDDPDCTPGSGATPRPEKLDAGNDTFPIWESCLLRPAFGTLYRDWENGTAQFPALGDAPSADPSDPHAPKATLGLSGTTFTSNGVTYVGAAHEFTAGATDEVFTDARIQAQYRIFKAGEAAGEWIDIAPNSTFSIPADAGDGTYKVQLRTADPCHTFDPSDELEAGAPVTREVVLDTTPPEITITKPAEGSLFDSDDFSAIEFTV
ncbi:MAG TPA: zinc dependent phospholipase C family protein, partial [Solirubrobacter sp.]|nr:zinc dependent phospholipase C family protein [Solirubrobacter sp.]